MVSILVVGKECNTSELAVKIEEATFDCLLVAMADEMRNTHEVWKFLNTLSNATADLFTSSQIGAILKEKHVHMIKRVR